MLVLVTGAAGVLGQQLAPRLQAAGHVVRGSSRRPRAATDDVNWVEMELVSGRGLATAVDGVDVVIHAASNAGRGARKVDVVGTGQLVRAAEQAGVRHFIYISIVGIDRIPLGYYKAKLAAEAAIAAGSVPWSVVRATQFHELMDMVMRGLNRLPVVPLPRGFLFQPIDSGEVAARLVEVVAAGPNGRLPDIAGPEVQDVRALAEQWQAARNRRRPLWEVPLPGAVAAGYRAGHNTAPNGRYGTISWNDWLQRAPVRAGA